MSDYVGLKKAEFSEEVDLVECCRTIWKQRILVVGVTILFGLAASVYLFFADRLYRVSTVLRPAAISELDAVNRSGIYQLLPGDALLKIAAALGSHDMRWSFFRANEALFDNFKKQGYTREQSFDAFNGDFLTLIRSDPKTTDDFDASLRLDLTYNEGVNGVTILNDFVNYTIDTERDRIIADLKIIIERRVQELNEKVNAAQTNYNIEKAARIASLLEADALKRAQLQDELKALRLQLKTGRNDRIEQLNEAINIAKGLGIKKPATHASLASVDRPVSGSVMHTEVNSQQMPLYYMGSEALGAERSVLQQRSSDDFTEKRVAQIAKELQLLQVNREVQVLNKRANEDIFLRDMEPIRSELLRLGNLNFEVGNVKLVTLDQVAVEPLAPLAPKKVLVLLLSLALGGIVGFILAVVRHVINVQGQPCHP